MSKKKYLTTPRGVAKFPSLHKADVKYNKDGEYKCTILFPEEALTENPKLAAFVAELERIRDEKVEELKGELKAADLKKLKVLPVYSEEEDAEGELTGNIQFRSKLKAIVRPEGKDPFTQKPSVFDAKGTLLKKVPAVFGGSEVQLSVEPRPYYSAKDKEVGITLRLRGARILSLVTGGERDAGAYGFDDDEEGDYVAPGEDEFNENDSPDEDGANEDEPNHNF